MEELAKYKQIFDHSLDVMIVTDGEKGEIIDVNQACYDILGYQPDDLIGKHYSYLFPGKDDFLINDLQMYGDVVSFRNIQKADGKLCPMDLTINVLEYGTAKVVLTTLRDVTERIEAEQKIRKYAEELRNLIITKDKFFSIISHDLKNLFSALLSFADILITEFDEMDDGEKTFMVTEIGKVSKDSYQLLDNLLQWARAQTGNLEYSPEEVNFCELVDENISIFQTIATNKKIELISFCDSTRKVYCDINLVKTVLRNLISNAIKFSHRGGKVTVATEDKNGNLIVRINDNGIGMDQKTMNNLFQAGRHLTKPGTEKEPGNGLGLILVKEFVEKNGGEIWVDSNPGEGSTFSFSIPSDKSE